MSKQQVKQSALEKKIMDKIRSDEVQMKPRWYFVSGSLLLFMGIVSFSIIAVFLTTVTMFLLRQHGPRGAERYELLWSSFPWWMPFFAVVGIIGGILLLKRYDFSYKKNFVGIIIIFILAVIAAAVAIDKLVLNDFWSRQGYGQGFYRNEYMQRQMRENTPDNTMRMHRKGRMNEYYYNKYDTIQ